jgi:ADP-heptose:LPS heptosyltransferase/O-antigen ligase
MRTKTRWRSIWSGVFECSAYLLVIGIPFGRSLIEIGAVGLIVSWAIIRWMDRNGNAPGASLKVPLGGLLVISGLSVMWSHHPSLSHQAFWAKTLEYLGLYLVFSDAVGGLKQIRRLLTVWVICTLAVCLDGVGQLILGHDPIRGFAPGLMAAGARMTATMQYPNDLGIYLAVSISLMVGILWALGKRHPFVSIAVGMILVFATGCLILTYSRSAWLGLLTAAGFFWIALRKDRNRKAQIVWVVGLLGLAVCSQTHFFTRGNGFFDHRPGTSAAERMLIWEGAVRMFKDRPILGHGLNTFNAVFPHYKPPQVWGTPYAHNSYLQLAAEQGLIGLGLFLWALGFFFMRALRTPITRWEGKVACGISAAVAGYAVHSLFEPGLYTLPLAVLFWTLLGMGSFLQTAVRFHPDHLADWCENVLIVRTDRMGDLLLTLPAVEAIRRGWPKARMTLLIHSDWEPLFQSYRAMADIWTTDRYHGDGWRFGWHWSRRIAKARFDAAFVFHPSRAWHVACWLAGVPIRVGYRRKWGQWLLSHSIPDTKAKRSLHESAYNLELVQCVGIPATDHPPSYSFPLDPKEEKEVEALLTRFGLTADRLIALHPWTSNPTKAWPLARFLDVAKQLKERELGSVAIIGEPNPTDWNPIHRDHPDGWIDLTGRIPLDLLPAFLKRCSLLISNDSGPAHLAAMVGTPTWVIVPSSHPHPAIHRWAPLGNEHRILIDPTVEDVVAMVASFSPCAS